MSVVVCVNDACSESGVVKELAATLAPGEVVKCGGMTPDGPCWAPLEVRDGEPRG